VPATKSTRSVGKARRLGNSGKREKAAGGDPSAIINVLRRAAPSLETIGRTGNMNGATTTGWMVTLFAVAAPWFSAVSLGQTAMFSVKELPNIPGATEAYAYGINDAGDVIGVVCESTACPGARPVVWSNGTPTLLGAVAGSTTTFATSINNAGQVVGYAGGVGAVIWNNGTPTVLPANAYATQGIAYSVNDAGQVVGDAAVTPIEWNGVTPTTLGVLPGLSTSAAAYGINNSGFIVGILCCTDDTVRAVVWHGTVPTLLPRLVAGTGSSEAFAVNDSGLVVGEAGTNYELVVQAAAWAGDTITSLGTLNTMSSAFAVNNRGVIVGQSDTDSAGDYHAVIWGRVGAPIQDLNRLISATAAAEVVLTEALAINDHCTIAAQGYTRKTNMHQAFLLILNDPSQCVKGL
jgi:uncharacterized membrane protein